MNYYYSREADTLLRDMELARSLYVGVANNTDAPDEEEVRAAWEEYQGLRKQVLAAMDRGCSPPPELTQ